jgi:hypothetical protein
VDCVCWTRIKHSALAACATTSSATALPPTDFDDFFRTEDAGLGLRFRDFDLLFLAEAEDDALGLRRSRSKRLCSVAVREGVRRARVSMFFYFVVREGGDNWKIVLPAQIPQETKNAAILRRSTLRIVPFRQRRSRFLPKTRALVVLRLFIGFPGKPDSE